MEARKQLTEEYIYQQVLLQELLAVSYMEIWNLRFIIQWDVQ